MSDPGSFDITHLSYQQKSLASDWLEKAYQRNWFKLFLPKSLGGLELTLAEGLEQIRLASEIHGSLGWCINLGSGAGYFYRCFQADTANKLFAEPKAVLAGSGQASGKAIAVEGGFRISGSWDKCSGAAYATAFTGNAVFEDGKVHSVVFMRNQVQIEDNWNMFGMKATSSFRFDVDQVFVPEEFVFDIGVRRYEDQYAIMEIPFDIFARFCMIATLIGTVSCFTQHLEKAFPSKIRQFEKDFENLRQKLVTDNDSMFQLAERYWSLAKNGSGFTEHHLLNLQAGIRSISRSLFDMSCDLYYQTGIGLADEKTIAHQAFRDVMMAAQHGMLK